MTKRERENYDRVTNILYPFSGLDKVNPEVVAYAGERGSRVHETCEGIISGLGELGVDDETWGYVESFKKWWEKGHHVYLMEERFYDDELQLTGKVDLILKRGDEFVIFDLKTSSKPSKTWPAQGAAYAYLAKKAGLNVTKIEFLHLNKHGKEGKIYEYPVDDSFFLNIYRVWKHFYGVTNVK
jgi:hypothetical protein